MTRKNQHYYITFRYALDALSILLAFGVIQNWYPSAQTTVSNQVFFVILSILIWYISSIHSKLYAERRSNKFSEEIIFVFYNSIVFSILLSAVLFFIKLNIAMEFKVFLLYSIVIFLFAICTKYVHRKYIHSILSQGKMYEKILLIGGNPSAEFFYETVNKYYYYGYQCMGFIDDNITKLNGCPYFGKVDKLQTVLKSEIVDEVVITLPNSEYENIKKCVDTCEYLRVPVRILPDAYKYTTSSARVDNIGFMPVLNINELPLDHSW